jgi:hypothetical protein
MGNTKIQGKVMDFTSPTSHGRRPHFSPSSSSLYIISLGLDLTLNLG